MFDTHCHLQDKAFDADRDAVLSQAREAGVTHVVAPATDVGSFDATLHLAGSHENVYCALGVHPHSASEWSQPVRKRIVDECAQNQKIVAIGEIGLDYHYNFSPPEVQRMAFREQIELARQLRKPIVVHSRESDEDVFAIIREQYAGQADSEPRGQLHCFSSGVERMHEAVELGFFISFTGNITFKKSTLDRVVRETPLDRLLIETDSPYLTPHPFRGQRNAPAFLQLVAEKVAEIKEIDVSAVMTQTFENALRFFRIASTFLFLFILLGAGIAHAQRQQPIGGAPPDSVMTPERRRAEEMRKAQEVELQKEAEQRRQDSIKAVAQQQEETMAHIREQARQDSIKAAQKIQEEEQLEAFLLTPMPWKAVGLGFSAGISDMPMILGSRTLVPLSVFSYSIDASTALTRRLDVDFSLSHMVVGGPLPQDSLFANGLSGRPTFPYNPNLYNATNPFPKDTIVRLINSETFTAETFAFDLRYSITRPTAVLKFYFGIGYTYVRMTNEEHYSIAINPTTSDNSDRILSQTWSRGGIKMLFGMRHDFELGRGLTLEPFAQIAGIGVFQGEKQNGTFVLVPDPDQIIMTQLNVGFTLYYGWFGVPRQQ